MNMANAKHLCFLFSRVFMAAFVFFYVFTVALAADAPVVDPVALQALNRVGASFRNAKSVSYSVSVSEIETGSGGALQIPTVSGMASFSRNGCWRIDLTSGGKLAASAGCGSSGGFSIDYVNNRYAIFPISAPSDVQREAINRSLSSLPATTATLLLNMMSGESPFSLSAILNADSLSRLKGSIGLSDEKYDGKNSLGVTQFVPISSDSHISLKILVDPDTVLPQELSLNTNSGGVVSLHQEEYSNWNLSLQLLDPAQFEFSVPTGARQVTYSSILPVGARAPDIQAQDQSGKSVHLSAFLGKIVLLDFWSPSMDSSLQDLKRINQIFQRTELQGVVFMPLCVWTDKGDFDSWVHANWTMPGECGLYFDAAAKEAPKSAAIAQFLVDSLPTTFVIGRDGKVLASIVGFSGVSDRRIEDALSAQGIDVGPRPEK